MSITYAEAVKIIVKAVPEMDVYISPKTEKALAVLRRAEKLMEAVEKACPEYLQGELVDLKRMAAKSEDRGVLEESIPILRAALRYRDEKEKP